MTDFRSIEKKAIDASYPKLCCPEIISAHVEIFPICANPSYRKKIKVPDELKFVRCINCSFKCKVIKLEKSLLDKFMRQILEKWNA